MPLPKLRRQSGDGDKSPLFRQGGPRAVLCLHGFTGTPFEVRPLAESLAGQGFTVSAPLLAGHGDTVEALERTHWPDWLHSAEIAFDELRALSPGPIAILGFSMGGLLALRLARLRPHDVAALAILAPPLRLRPWHATAVRVLGSLPRALRGPLSVLPKLRGYDVSDEEMKRRNPGLPGVPLEGALSLLELGEMVRRDLPFIKTPTLVAHGAKDRTVPMGDSLELAGTIGTDVLERVWLQRSGHLLAIDVERTALAEAICRFFNTRVPVVKATATEGTR
jgi:carboxylesterase